MTNTNTGAAVASGWYAEPGTGRQRWWDGAAWGALKSEPTSPGLAVRPQPGYPETSEAQPVSARPVSEVHPFTSTATTVAQPRVAPATVAPVVVPAPQSTGIVPAHAAPHTAAFASAHPVPAVRPGNGFAIAALVLGIWGFVTTPIPFFIGLFLGGIPNILAITFGIIGIVRANRISGRGRVMAVFGLVLGGLAFLSVFLGAGTIW